MNVDHEDGTREGSDAENGSGSEAGELDDEVQLMSAHLCTKQ